MCREEYEDVAAWRSRKEVTEDAWPEYEESLVLLSKRAYLADGNMDDQKWRDTYLRDHVQRVHELKQNHVHLPNQKGEMMPLAHCQRKDNPHKCKSDFPRKELKRAVVLCPGLLQELGLPTCGRKNRVGSLGGPRNESMINGTHSLLSAMPFSQTNSDVQLPYRFPTTVESHADDLCSSQCALAENFKEVVHAMQSQQDAQIGYSCDYQNKRAAKSCNEVKESMKGHRKLAVDNETKRPDYIGKRHVSRLHSDVYGRGITRSQQESTNLRATGVENVVTSSEFFSTSELVPFPGADACKWREAYYENTETVGAVANIKVDWRNPQRRTPIIRNIVFLYGHRPKYVSNKQEQGFSDLWHLSLYEFLVHWTVEPAIYALDKKISEISEKENDSLHAQLSPSGRQKLEKMIDLEPGVDYHIKSEWPKSGAWATLGDSSAADAWKHDWIFSRNRRPVDPYFARCPMPRQGKDQEDKNAALLLTYLHPWTLDPHPEAGDENVPHLKRLCTPGSSWQQSLLEWFGGKVLCTEAKTYIDNFLAVTRARPFEEELHEHSDDQFSDEELCVDKNNFAKIVKTRMGAATRKKKIGIAMKSNSDSENDVEHPDAVIEAFALAETLWPVPQDRNKGSRKGLSKLTDDDINKALTAAKASQKKEHNNNEAELKPWDPKLRKGKAFTENNVWSWYGEQAAKKTVRKKQLEMLHIVCQRVCDELAENSDGVFRSPPLIHLLHGVPGTGKSEVLKMIRNLFQEVCGWEQGLDFQMLSLQAVTAELLAGDTIHHALGINPFPGSANADGKKSQRQTDVAKQVSQWRWIFIDEISMVSAKLLAEVDMKMRNLVSKLESLKCDQKGVSRAFGGINIVFVGDFWQIDPPSGGFIASIPVEFIRKARQYDPKPDIAHGQSIFWHSGEGCVQGMTELTECVRTEDEWLYSVQEEMRHGNLSEDNWKFLHGMQSTTVPGSWLKDRCTCGTDECLQTWRRKKMECVRCQEERKSKHLVMNSNNERRHLSTKFLRAPAIFPNNDIKYEVNKIRAQIYARATQQALTLSLIHI